MLSGIARLTNAMDEMGDPLVFSISTDSSTIQNAIVEAVEISAVLPIDIDARPAASCDALEGLTITSSGTVLGVSPGETACFDLDFTNTNEILSGMCEVAFSTAFGTVLGTIPVDITCPALDPLICGPSIVTDTCAILSLECCDETTDALGPACCGTLPHNPDESSCCDDGSLVEGSMNEDACEPIRQTCEMGNPCKYKLEEDGMDGFVVDETYFPVCIQYDDDDKLYQECYSERIIAGSGEGDPDPKYPEYGIIVNCGCCPSDDELPVGIKSVKGSTNICEGGLDCIAANTPYEISKSVKKTKFQMCIYDEEKYKKYFYVPYFDDEGAHCGPCEEEEETIVV